MMTKTFCHLLVLSLLELPLPASAVCSLLGCSCTVSTTTGIVFGSYRPIPVSTDVAATGNVHLSCTNGPAGGDLTYDIALGPGHGTVVDRQMDNIADTNFHLKYNLYTEPTHTIVWGDGSGGTVVSSVVNIPYLLGGTRTADHTVYGLIPGGTQPTAHVGSYSDLIIVTVTITN